MLSFGMLLALAVATAVRSRGLPLTSPPRARRDGNFLDELGKKFAALGVLGPFFMFDRAPLGMSRHNMTSFAIKQASTIPAPRKHSPGPSSTSRRISLYCPL